MVTSKPHVVILSSPGMGHVAPCLELAKYLGSHHAVEVTLFVPSTESPTQQTQLLESLVLPQDLHVISLPPVDMSDIPADTQIPSRLANIVRRSLPAVRSIILESPRPPMVLLADLFSTCAFELAEELEMEKYLFFASNATVLAYMFYIPKLIQETDGEFFEIPGCNPIHFKDLGSNLFHQKLEAASFMLEQVSSFHKASGVLINTFEDLEPQTIRCLSNDDVRGEIIPVLPLYPVGPLTKSHGGLSRTEEFDCLTWLDKQPRGSVVFISFGSGGTMSAEQVNELAWGLELSKKHFLWVVRPPQRTDSLDNYLKASDGHNDPSEYLPDGFISRTQDIGLVVPNWAPQTEILSHESVGAFISHCGWNSSLESIVHGVPMITWHLYAEQNWNAFLLANDIGVAVQLAKPTETSESKLIGREKIEKAVKLVMQEEEGKVLRKKVNELKNSAMAATRKGGSSYECVAKLVENWKCSLASTQ